MLNNPKDFSDKELANYLELVKETNVMTNLRGAGAKKSKKWQFLEKHFPTTSGEGVVVMLPGDINSLKDRLRVLCAERAAGNVRATTSEIVAILDELLRRNYISREEYNDVSKGLGC